MSRIQTVAMVLRAIPDFTAEYRRLIDALQTVGSMLLSSNRRSAFKLVQSISNRRAIRSSRGILENRPLSSFHTAFHILRTRKIFSLSRLELGEINRSDEHYRIIVHEYRVTIRDISVRSGEEEYLLKFQIFPTVIRTYYIPTGFVFSRISSLVQDNETKANLNTVE